MVQFAHQPDVGAELEEVDGEARAPVGRLKATGPGLARHNRCHRTCCEAAPLAAPWGKPAVEESACEGRIGFAAVAGIAVADDSVVAGKVVGVRVSGGDSSPARGRLECHNRRTSIRCLQGLQREEKSNSSVMQVAEADNSGARMCSCKVSCDVNEWIGEWRTAVRINQCMRMRVVVLW